MVSLKLAAALAAVGLFTSGIVFAEGAKPNDAQSRILPTRRASSTLKLPNRPSRKARIRMYSLSRPTWSEITKR